LTINKFTDNGDNNDEKEEKSNVFPDSLRPPYTLDQSKKGKKEMQHLTFRRQLFVI
jgi:hypothetical protein